MIQSTTRSCPGLRHLTTTKQQIQDFEASPNLHQSAHQGQKIPCAKTLTLRNYILTDEMMMTQKQPGKKQRYPPDASSHVCFGSNPPLPRPYSSETVEGLAAAAALAATDFAAFASRCFFKMSHFVKTAQSPGMRYLFICVATECRNQMITDVSSLEQIQVLAPRGPRPPPGRGGLKPRGEAMARIHEG